MRKLQGLALALAGIAAAGTTENYAIENTHLHFSYKPKRKNNHEGINSKSRFKQRMAFKKHCKSK